MAKKEEEIQVAGDTLARNLDELDRLTVENSTLKELLEKRRKEEGHWLDVSRLKAELKAKDEQIWQLKLDIKVISECKIHCKNCNARIKQALKGE